MGPLKTIWILCLVGLSRPAPAQQLDSLSGQFRLQLYSFQEYLHIITNPETPAEDRQLAIERALDMFEKNSTIQLTSARRPNQIQMYSINEYLQNLSLLGYRKATFGFRYISLKPRASLPKDSSRQYVGLFSQVFYGQKARIKYADVTRKTVEVVLKPVQDPFDKATNWHMLFRTVRISK